MLGRYRFYNAGEKWSFSLAYSIPSTPDTADDIHCVANYEVVCPAEGWFEVPDELNVGGALIQVRFAQYLTLNFGNRGIVLLDRNRENIGAAEPVAASEADVIEKAKELWLAYLNGIAVAHLDWCSRVRAAGNSPPAATGFTKRALKRLGIADPADVLLDQLRVKPASGPGIPTSGEIEELRETIRRQGEMLEKLLAGGNGNGRAGQYDLELKGKGK